VIESGYWSIFGCQVESGNSALASGHKLPLTLPGVIPRKKPLVVASLGQVHFSGKFFESRIAAHRLQQRIIQNELQISRVPH
jgi:hypothetical protein